MNRFRSAWADLSACCSWYPALHQMKIDSVDKKQREIVAGISDVSAEGGQAQNQPRAQIMPVALLRFGLQILDLVPLPELRFGHFQAQPFGIVAAQAQSAPSDSPRQPPTPTAPRSGGVRVRTPLCELRWLIRTCVPPYDARSSTGLSSPPPQCPAPSVAAR